MLHVVGIHGVLCGTDECAIIVKEQAIHTLKQGDYDILCPKCMRQLEIRFKGKNNDELYKYFLKKGVSAKAISTDSSCGEEQPPKYDLEDN